MTPIKFDGPSDFVARVGQALETYRNPDGTQLPETVRDILLAQSAFEVNWGRTIAAYVHNYFNLSSGPDWKGPVLDGPDTEVQRGGKVINITQHWRVYENGHECFKDYLENWLRWGRYSRARGCLMAGDLQGFLKWLRDDDPATTKQVEGGYYTLEYEKYLRGVWRTMSIVKSLQPSP